MAKTKKQKKRNPEIKIRRRSGYRVPGNADAKGRVMLSIYRKQGFLLASDVVKAAKIKSSPLHDAFEWNNKKAAAAYRLDQASYLIQALRPVEIDENGDEVELSWRLFVSVKTTVTKGRGKGKHTRVFIQETDALAKPETRKQVLEDALADLQAFMNKYDKLKELSAIRTAIKKILKKYDWD